MKILGVNRAGGIVSISLFDDDKKQSLNLSNELAEELIESLVETAKAQLALNEEAKEEE